MCRELLFTLWPQTYMPLGGIGMLIASTTVLQPMSRSDSPYSSCSTGRHLYSKIRILQVHSKLLMHIECAIPSLPLWVISNHISMH